MRKKSKKLVRRYSLSVSIYLSLSLFSSCTLSRVSDSPFLSTTMVLVSRRLLVHEKTENSSNSFTSASPFPSGVSLCYEHVPSNRLLRTPKHARARTSTRCFFGLFFLRQDPAILSLSPHALKSSCVFPKQNSERRFRWNPLPLLFFLLLLLLLSSFFFLGTTVVKQF